MFGSTDSNFSFFIAINVFTAIPMPLVPTIVIGPLDDSIIERTLHLIST